MRRFFSASRVPANPTQLLTSRNSRVAPRPAKGSSVAPAMDSLRDRSMCWSRGHQRRVCCRKRRHSVDDGPGTSDSEIFLAGCITATNVSLNLSFKTCLSLPLVTRLCSISLSNTSGLAGSCRCSADVLVEPVDGPVVVYCSRADAVVRTHSRALGRSTALFWPFTRVETRDSKYGQPDPL